MTNGISQHFAVDFAEEPLQAPAEECLETVDERIEQKLDALSETATNVRTDLGEIKATISGVADNLKSETTKVIKLTERVRDLEIGQAETRTKVAIYVSVATGAIATIVTLAQLLL